jgi:hypothetical protein
VLARIVPLLALALATTACGSAVASSSATRLYVAPTGNDSGSCSKGSPCQSFGRAYRTAKPGDTVELAAGTYPAQQLDDDSSKRNASADVLFVPAAGATVTVDGDLVVYGSHVVFKGGPKPYTLLLRTAWARAPASHVRFENIDGASFQIFGSSFVTIKGGDWGPAVEPDDMESRISPDGGVLNSYPHDIVLDGLLVHGSSSPDLTQYHSGGMELVSGYKIAIRNSTFTNNVIYNIEVQDFTSPACCGMKYGNAYDVTIENNRFEHPVLAPPYGSPDQNDGQAELQFDPQGGPWKGWTIRRNWFENGLGLAFDGPATSYENVLVEGNLGGSKTDCGGQATGATWRNNIWEREPCGSGDLKGLLGYRVLDGRLVPDGSSPTVKRAFAAASGKNASARTVARAVGLHVADVRKLLANHAYLGDTIGPAGAHAPLVSRKTWAAAQKAARR